MPRFRKKPVEVDAVRVADLLTTATGDWSALPPWITAAYQSGEMLFFATTVEIQTLEGVMRGDWVDWVIQGVHGELYPIKDAIFAATYEPVDEPAEEGEHDAEA